ncbi:hypothetical protein MUGA111182_16245 [Mucilaginibacter galii]|uniref:Uncharacterized protein n=1 Tax=Mucilaginibacter galii TaxID=2005073 RepID=A0A917JBJ4_9SPHI|nr:hypothetical protein [Mucilaginibacter galii]GGI52318.1 hypothetical protein GCM10011425_35300 [Mucilaginibacter galii]
MPGFDLLKGQIILSENLILCVQTVPSQLFNYFKHEEVKFLDLKNGWMHYQLENVKIQDKYFKFDLAFLGERLKSISFSFQFQTYEPSSWDAWSEKEELQKYALYENWLTIEVGVHRNYP